MPVRIAAVVLTALTLAGSASGGAIDARVVYVHDGALVVTDLAARTSQVVLARAPLGPVAWSGDGKLLSDAGQIVGGPTLPTSAIAWAPEGETAAYRTAAGAVYLWTPAGGSHRIVPAGWGVRSLAWGPGGKLALGRKEYPGQGAAAHQEVWVWQAGGLRRVVGPLPRDRTPIVEGFTPDGRVLWWDDLYDSGSIRADGLTLSANGKRLGKTLVFPDFVRVCGTHLVFAEGGDRYTTKGKSIVYDGRDVSRDRRLSWVSPSCNGTEVVAAAGRSRWERRFGEEGRSLWELVPRKERLTRPPAGWTDELPMLLPDGSVLFVRTRETPAGGGAVRLRAGLELLAGGAVRPVASLSLTVAEDPTVWDPNFYGHYGWPQLVAVTAYPATA